MAEPATPIIIDDPIMGPVAVADGVTPNPFPKPATSNGDSPPKGNSQGNPANPPKRKPRARKATKVTDAALRDILTEALTAPGVAYSMARMDWPAQHVLRTGPDLADAIVAYSKTNEWLRTQLEKLASGDTALGMMIALTGVLMAGAAYVVPLLAYHGVIPKHVGEKLAQGDIPSPGGIPDEFA